MLWLRPQQIMAASRHKYPLWDFKNLVVSGHNKLYWPLVAKIAFIKVNRENLFTVHIITKNIKHYAAYR